VSALARALLDELGPDDLAELAARLAPFLPAPEDPAPDGWLSTREAASHLGISVNALHKLTAARAIRFEQAKPGGRCWFRRSDLDAWRAGEATS
jgi:excisionase family DNA binding protein